MHYWQMRPQQTRAKRRVERHRERRRLARVTVTGKVMPLIENSEGFAPLSDTEDTVTLAPLAVRVPLAVPLAPTTTLPTAIVMGLTLRVPGAGAVLRSAQCHGQTWIRGIRCDRDTTAESIRRWRRERDTECKLVPG